MSTELVPILARPCRLSIFFIICRRGGHYLGRHRISYLVSATHRPKAERIFQLFFSCFFFACQRVGYSNGILQIDSSSSLSKNSAGSSSSSTSGSSQILRVSPQTLVYLESSPDFCLVNSTAGQCSPSSSMFVSDEVVPCRRYRRYSVAILMTELVVFFCGMVFVVGTMGTKGRTCSRDKGTGLSGAQRRSCHHLCKTCGHKVKRHVTSVLASCNCTFQWCCQVQCQTCRNTVTKYTCA